MDVPQDLADALTANPRAQAVFQTLTSANRYSILYRIGSAKKLETQARRIEQFVEMLARGETDPPARSTITSLIVRRQRRGVRGELTNGKQTRIGCRTSPPGASAGRVAAPPTVPTTPCTR